MCSEPCAPVTFPFRVCLLRIIGCITFLPERAIRVRYQGSSKPVGKAFLLVLVHIPSKRILGLFVVPPLTRKLDRDIVTRYSA